MEPAHVSGPGVEAELLNQKPTASDPDLIGLWYHSNDLNEPSGDSNLPVPRTGGIKVIFTGGHISLVVDFKGPNVIFGLYKCKYSLTRGKELGS